MIWEMNGTRIRAFYIDRLVDGEILSSSVKPNLVVLHKVKLDKPFTHRQYQKPKHEVLIDHNAIQEIL